MWDLDITLRWAFGDERFLTRLHSGVLLRDHDKPDVAAAATVTVPDGVLVYLCHRRSLVHRQQDPPWTVIQVH